jgi:hypothetical protein
MRISSRSLFILSQNSEQQFDDNDWIRRFIAIAIVESGHLIPDPVEVNLPAYHAQRIVCARTLFQLYTMAGQSCLITFDAQHDINILNINVQYAPCFFIWATTPILRTFFKVVEAGEPPPMNQNPETTNEGGHAAAGHGLGLCGSFAAFFGFFGILIRRGGFPLTLMALKICATFRTLSPQVVPKLFPEGCVPRLRESLNRARSVAEQRRGQAVLRRALNAASVGQIAMVTGLRVNTVRVRHSRYLREGDAVLVGRPGRGGRNRSHLCAEQEAGLPARHVDRAGAGGLVEAVRSSAATRPWSDARWRRPAFAGCWPRPAGARLRPAPPILKKTRKRRLH